jgi:hypothetical protein
MRRLGAVLAVVAVSFATAAGVATAQAAIQTYASRLRNVLGRGAISSDRDGLRLDLDREQVEGYGIPLGRVLAGAQRHDSPLLAPTLDLLDRSSTASGRLDRGA